MNTKSMSYKSFKSKFNLFIEGASREELECLYFDLWIELEERDRLIMNDNRPNRLLAIYSKTKDLLKK